MPPKFKFTRDEVLRAALDLTREKGMIAVTARGVAERLGCSVKPVFGLFKNMEEVHRAVISSAKALFENYVAETTASGKYPPYKASGMAYIRFAIEERELFKLLYMRDRSHENIQNDAQEIKPILELLKESLGLTEEKASLFHLEMWVYVHGIATMLATSYLDWDIKLTEQVITDAYEGLKYRFTGGNK